MVAYTIESQYDHERRELRIVASTGNGTRGFDTYGITLKNVAESEVSAHVQQFAGLYSNAR